MRQQQISGIYAELALACALTGFPPIFFNPVHTSCTVRDIPAHKFTKFSLKINKDRLKIIKK